VVSALDLMPFDFLQSAGAQFFFHKIFSQLQLPCRKTLSSQGLDDICEMVRTKVVADLCGIKVLCAMFDGWSDSHGFPSNRIYQFEVGVPGSYTVLQNASRSLSCEYQQARP